MSLWSELEWLDLSSTDTVDFALAAFHVAHRLAEFPEQEPEIVCRVALREVNDYMALVTGWLLERGEKRGSDAAARADVVRLIKDQWAEIGAGFGWGESKPIDATKYTNL